EKIHQKMLAELPLDDFFPCYHDGDGCDCRKPKPGLIFQGQKKYDVELSQSYMIGDRWRDIDAGHAAGLPSILLDYQYKERGPSLEPELRVKKLNEAVDWILSRETIMNQEQ